MKNVRYTAKKISKTKYVRLAYKGKKVVEAKVKKYVKKKVLKNEKRKI